MKDPLEIMNHRQFHGMLIGCVLAAAFSSASAAVQFADYARAEQFMPYNTEPLVWNTAEEGAWLPGGKLSYWTRTAGGIHVVSVDPLRRTRAVLADLSALAASLAGTSAVSGEVSDPTPHGIALSADETQVSFELGSTHWDCELHGARCSAIEPGSEAVSISPNKQRAAFIREYNLWVRDLSTGKEKALTTDGVKDFGYATDNPGWQHTNRPILTWSPDSNKIATFQQDQRGVGEMHLVATQLGHPRLESWKYAMAGDPVIATIQRVVIDVNSSALVRLQVPPDPHRSSPCYDVQCGDGGFADVQWSADGSRLAFISTSRDHKRALLREADAVTGQVREVLEETASTFYESDLSSTTHGAVNWRYLRHSREVIWYSTRDNWAHLYLYDLDSGKLRRQITKGDWNVVEVLQTDEKRRTIYFSGVGRETARDPYFVHLYKVGFDGKNLTLLTPEDANHEISMAPSGEYFLDRYSRPDIPPVALLRDKNGRLIMTLEKADISPLLRAGWKPPASITVKARDASTDLYGLLFKPTNFDPQHKYPIIDWVYPGPLIGSVGTRSFVASRGDRQSLAELGFIVVAIDGMGTPFRSKSFHDAYYGNLRDNTLPDQLAGLKQLAQRHPWIDLERAGIYGHSGGGYAAAAALFSYPDFFKVGISESGNHDQLGYTDDWGEKFIGLLERTPDGETTYDRQDTPSIAKNLKAHLLLMHGAMDDNVPPYLTLLLVDALIKANKDFDLLMLPNQHHYYTGAAGTYSTRRRWDYFVRYLLGTEPPHEYPMRRLPDGVSATE